MAKRYRGNTSGAAKKKNTVKAVALGLVAVLAVGLLGGVAAHIVNTKYNPSTLDGGVKKVSGVVGFTNSTGVLTYTGDLAEYNEADETGTASESSDETTTDRASRKTAELSRYKFKGLRPRRI